MTKAGPMTLRITERPLPLTIAQVVKLTDIQAQTLVALVEDGPLPTDSIPSFEAAVFLARQNWSVEIVVHGEIGYYAATQEGRLAYCKLLDVDCAAEGRLKRSSNYHIKKK